MEDETSMGAFYQRYAEAKLEESDTREQLLEYFADKIDVVEQRLTVASWFYDGGDPITSEEFTEATDGSHAGQLVRVFNMGPQGYVDAGIDTRPSEHGCPRPAGSLLPGGNWGAEFGAPYLGKHAAGSSPPPVCDRARAS